MRIRRYLTIGILGAGGCGSFVGDDRMSNPPPDVVQDDDAGSDEGVDAQVVAPPGDVTAPPDEDELTEVYGIFVSLAGTSDGEGTREKPISSIASALTKAKEQGKRVYVCQGTYKENIVLLDAVSISGGYECAAEWTATNDGRSRIEAPTSPAVRAKDIVHPTNFIGFDVVAPDGDIANSSSIGLIVENSKQLRISRSSITAGKGLAGASGTESSPPGPGAATSGGQGLGSSIFYDSAPPSREGGQGGKSACGGKEGGDGGSGGVMKCSLHIRADGVQSYYMAYTTAAGTPELRGGAAGASGKDGTSAQGLGTLSSDGYVPADGTMGSHGSPGDGGSGGAPDDDVACTASHQDMYVAKASGPGGGAGGCGGVAGTPGKGGGASIAALVLSSSDLIFEDTKLLAGKGGDGGKGTLGSAPTAGGAPGKVPTGAGAAQPGQRGGRPGVSGSGAGGPSFGLAHHGGQPKLSGTTVVKAGEGGAGVPTQSTSFQELTWTLQPSVPGLAADVFAF